MAKTFLSESYFYNVDPPQIERPSTELKMRQQPSYVRACGLGQRDRRAIHPPPIVELILGGKVNSKEQGWSYLMKASIIYNDKDCSINSKDEERGQFPKLIGTTIVNAQYLNGDCDGSGKNRSKSIFFIFSDLSLTTKGDFKLKFDLIDMENMKNPLQLITSSQVPKHDETQALPAGARHDRYRHHHPSYSYFSAPTPVECKTGCSVTSSIFTSYSSLTCPTVTVSSSLSLSLLIKGLFYDYEEYNRKDDFAEIWQRESHKQKKQQISFLPQKPQARQLIKSPNRYNHSSSGKNNL